MEVMERKAADGCCVANADVAWKMDMILLRYRPIAPKPAAVGVAAAGTAVEPTPAGGRVKRRGGARRKAATGGVGGGRRGRKSRKVEAAAAPVVTLSLMPETPERKEGGVTAGSPLFYPPELEGKERSGVVVVVPRPVRAAGAWVTVESVADAWGVGVCGSGGYDEVRRRLEAEDCPAFVSDSADRVTWTNTAYRRMVVGGGGESPQSSSSSSSYNSSSSLAGCLSPTDQAAAEEEVRVALVTRGLVPGGACREFTCMARVRYACRRRGRVSLAVPCDVWRLEDGGLAWRLDVKAALSLSIGA